MTDTISPVTVDLKTGPWSGDGAGLLEFLEEQGFAPRADDDGVSVIKAGRLPLSLHGWPQERWGKYRRQVH